MATNDRDDLIEDEVWTNRKLDALDLRAGWDPDTGAGLARFRAGRAAGDGHRGRRWAWGAAAAAASCLCVTVLSQTSFAARCVEACVGLTTRVGQILNPRDVIAPAPADPAGAFVARAARVLAPEFSLDDAEGRPLRLSGLRGRVVLVNFWATWCVPCATEIPWFTAFQAEYGDRGFSAIGISLDDDGWTSVRPFASAQRIGYPLALGTDEVTRAFGGIGALPATFIIDRQGRIAATHVGIVPRSTYADEIGRVLAEP
jgi:peroxiredoxin